MIEFRKIKESDKFEGAGPFTKYLDARSQNSRLEKEAKSFTGKKRSRIGKSSYTKGSSRGLKGATKDVEGEPEEGDEVDEESLNRKDFLKIMEDFGEEYKVMGIRDEVVKQDWSSTNFALSNLHPYSKTKLLSHEGEFNFDNVKRKVSSMAKAITPFPITNHTSDNLITNYLQSHSYPNFRRNHNTQKSYSMLKIISQCSNLHFSEDSKIFNFIDKINNLFNEHGEIKTSEKTKCDKNSHSHSHDKNNGMNILDESQKPKNPVLINDADFDTKCENWQNIQKTSANLDLDFKFKKSEIFHMSNFSQTDVLNLMKNEENFRLLLFIWNKKYKLSQKANSNLFKIMGKIKLKLELYDSFNLESYKVRFKKVESGVEVMKFIENELIDYVNLVYKCDIKGRIPSVSEIKKVISNVKEYGEESSIAISHPDFDTRSIWSFLKLFMIVRDKDLMKDYNFSNVDIKLLKIVSDFDDKLLQSEDKTIPVEKVLKGKMDTQNLKMNKYFKLKKKQMNTCKDEEITPKGGSNIIKIDASKFNLATPQQSNRFLTPFPLGQNENKFNFNFNLNLNVNVNVQTHKKKGRPKLDKDKLTLNECKSPAKMLNDTNTNSKSNIIKIELDNLNKFPCSTNNNDKNNFNIMVKEKDSENKMETELTKLEMEDDNRTITTETEDEVESMQCDTEEELKIRDMKASGSLLLYKMGKNNLNCGILKTESDFKSKNKKKEKQIFSIVKIAKEVPSHLVSLPKKDEDKYNFMLPPKMNTNMKEIKDLKKNLTSSGSESISSDFRSLVNFDEKMTPINRDNFHETELKNTTNSHSNHNEIHVPINKSHLHVNPMPTSQKTPILHAHFGGLSFPTRKKDSSRSILSRISKKSNISITESAKSKLSKKLMELRPILNVHFEINRTEKIATNKEVQPITNKKSQNNENKYIKELNKNSHDKHRSKESMGKYSPTFNFFNKYSDDESEGNLFREEDQFIQPDDFL